MKNRSAEPLAEIPASSRLHEHTMRLPATRPPPQRGGSLPQRLTKPGRPSATPPASDNTPTYAAYTPSYLSPSDGRRKATVEDAGSLSGRRGHDATTPWGLGFQLGERSDALWNDGLKYRLVHHVAARDAGLTPDEMSAALARLAGLLPTLAHRLHTLAPSLLAGLATDPAAVAQNLLTLRAALPGTDVGAMVAARPQLALRPPSEATLAAAIDKLATTLETDAATIRDLLSHHPDLLDVEGVATAVAEGRRVLGARFDVASIVADPRVLFRFQSHELLIPYDIPGEDGAE